MWRCLYCHNPDTWTMTQRHPGDASTRAAEELRKYRHGLKVMAGGFTLSGGEPLMQHRFAVKLFAAAQGDGHPHRARHQRLLRRPADRRRARDDRPRAARHQDVGSGAPPAADRHGHRADARVRAPPRRAQAAGLGALRAGAGADRRPRGHRRRSPASPPASATSSASTCCRSTRWASTSGSSSAFPTRSARLEPPGVELVEQACDVFRDAGLKAY